MTAEIYALIGPHDGAVRYIGKANDSAKRLKSHLRDARRRKTPVYDWINMLAKSGMRPTFRVLEIADDWVEAERRLIAEARSRGERLLNVADGGDEPFCSPEVRAANGRKSKGRKWTPDFPNIHYMMLRLGHHLQFVRKSEDPVRIKAYSDKIDHIKSRIEVARQNGWIDILDAAYGVYLEAINNGTPNKVAAEKARQTITLQA